MLWPWRDPRRPVAVAFRHFWHAARHLCHPLLPVLRRLRHPRSPGRARGNGERSVGGRVADRLRPGDGPLSRAASRPWLAGVGAESGKAVSHRQRQSGGGDSVELDRPGRKAARPGLPSAGRGGGGSFGSGPAARAETTRRRGRIPGKNAADARRRSSASLAAAKRGTAPAGIGDSPAWIPALQAEPAAIRSRTILSIAWTTSETGRSEESRTIASSAGRSGAICRVESSWSRLV